MAKQKSATPADDVTPAAGFLPAPAIGDEPGGADEVIEARYADPRDVEIAALQARIAELEARGPAPVPGKKYVVSLRDAPTAVVAPEPGEHPWDAYCRATGVVSSQYSPAVTEAPDDAPVGIVRN